MMQFKCQSKRVKVIMDLENMFCERKSLLDHRNH